MSNSQNDMKRSFRMTSFRGRGGLQAIGTLALVCAAMLTFAQLAFSQEPTTSEPAGADVFDTTGLTDSPLAPEGTASSSGATIATDERDYAPGSIVTVTGSGWQPGESVRIVVDDDGLQEQVWQRDVTVTAAPDGTIGDFFDLPMWFVASYTITATGEQSGGATTTFTDAIAFGGCPSSTTILVTTTTDEFDNPANGTCSLREAIRTANGDTAPDTIIVPSGTYTLTINTNPNAGTGEDNSARGDLDVVQPVTILGDGARSTIIQAGTTTANGIDRVIDVRSGGLTMSGATVRHGRINEEGGGFRVRNFPGGSTANGLSLTDVTVANNNNNLGGNNNGGGIFSSQVGLSLDRVTVSGNNAGRDGGGVFITMGATLTNVTLTNNSAAVNRTGGGIHNDGGTTTLTNVTVSHNSVGAGGLGGGLNRQGGTLALRNTIVANNSVGASANANCNGVITNTSNNLDSGATCGFGTASGSKSNANADLGALQDNGGPTDTRALGGSSAATDAGTATSAPNIDQRSVSRPQGAAYDIGAFELSSVTLTKVNGTDVTFPYLTNDDVSSVGGTCAPALGNVSVTLGGSPTTPATTSCSAGGSWTLTLATELSDDGDYTFAASQVGATSSGNKVVTIDQTAPVVTLEKVNGSTRTFPYFTNQNVTSVGGSCTSGDGPVSVTLGGSATAPATASCSADGSWTLTLTTAVSAEGSHTFAASQTDAAGNPGGSGDKVVTIDKTAPTITAAATTIPGGDAYTAGTWTNKTVRVAFSCADGLSGVGTDEVESPVDVTDSGENQSVTSTGDCVDNAGNPAVAGSFTDIDIDKDAPTITAAATTIPGGDAYTAGTWTNKTVRVAFSCADGLSGVGTDEVESPVDVTDSGENQSVTSTGDCVDNAGNPAVAGSFTDIDIDKDAPTITAAATTIPGGDAYTAGTWTNKTVRVAFSCADGLSGVGTDEVESPVDVTDSGENQSVTSTGDCVDNAGNPAVAGSFTDIDIDKDAPTITAAATTIPGGDAYTAGTWTNKTVRVAFSCADGLSGVGTDEVESPVDVTDSGENQSVTSTGDCVDNAGNPAVAGSFTDIDIDKDAPTISNDSKTPASPNGDNGWYTSAVTNHFKATDGGSGLSSTCQAAFSESGNVRSVSTGTSEGSAVTVASGPCSDIAGNNAASINSPTFKIDLTDPLVHIDSPTDGSTTSSASVTVSGTASDTPSGLASVTVNGSPVTTMNPDGTWSTTVALECGPAPNTITAIAKDQAGLDEFHEIDVTRNCAQGPEGLHARFLSPLDESVKATTRIANKAKAGRVVPVQVELYSGATRLTSAEIAEGDVTLQVTKMQTCDPSATETLETYAAAGSANIGNLFRWSGTKMIFNLDTGNRAYAFAVNSCYRLNVVYKQTLISWAPALTAPATNMSSAADWWTYLQIVK